jgi:hypothetical protein
MLHEGDGMHKFLFGTGKGRVGAAINRMLDTLSVNTKGRGFQVPTKALLVDRKTMLRLAA